MKKKKKKKPQNPSLPCALHLLLSFSTTLHSLPLQTRKQSFRKKKKKKNLSLYIGISIWDFERKKMK